MENKSITHEQTGYTLLYYTGRAPLQLGKVEVRSTAVDWYLASIAVYIPTSLRVRSASLAAGAAQPVHHSGAAFPAARRADAHLLRRGAALGQ